MPNSRPLNTAAASNSTTLPPANWKYSGTLECPPRPASERVAADRMLDLLRAGGDVRTRKVRRLRTAVSLPGYENQLKLAIAVERMRRDL